MQTSTTRNHGINFPAAQATYIYILSWHWEMKWVDYIPDEKNTAIFLDDQAITGTEQL